MGGRMSVAGLAVVAVLGLAGAGCGSDDEDEAGGGGGQTQAAQPSRLAIELSGSARKPTFSVPRSVEGGVVEISFTNSAKGEHSAQLVRAQDGHTPQEALAAGQAWGEKGKALPGWALVVGGLGDVPAGQSASVTQELEPGKYVVADLASNVSAAFEVTGDSGAGVLASAGGTIEATEYEFAANGLKAGTSSVLFDNRGGEPHFIAGVKLKPGSTIKDARRFFKTEKGRPPFDERDSFNTAVIEGGQKQSIEVELTDGTYALICFVPDRAGGPPHAVKGMISEAVVGG